MGQNWNLGSWHSKFQRENQGFSGRRESTRGHRHTVSLNPIPGFLDSPGGGGYSGERRKRTRSRRRRRGGQVEEEVAEERIRRKLQFPNDERLAPSHYQTRRGTAVGRGPARQCLPLSGRMPQAIRPLCLSLSVHLPRELLMPPHATPPHFHPTPSITPSRGAAHLPGPNPHASTRGGHKWPAGRQRQGAG